MNKNGNIKNSSPLTVWIHAIEAAVVAVIMASIAGYYIADFFTSQGESKGSYYGINSLKPSFADEFSYARLLNLGILRGNYGYDHSYRSGSGYIPEYSYALADAANYYFLLSDGVVKYFSAPAGTYGDAGGVSRANLFNDDNRSDFNIPESPTPGWSPSTNVAKSSNIAGSGELIIIIFPLPEPRSGSGLGSGIGLAPTPTSIPAALPLFGSGLALLWVLRRASKS